MQQLQTVYDLTRGASSSIFDFAQFGFYLITIGLIVALIFQIISACAKEEELKCGIAVTILPNSTTIEAHAFQGNQLASVTIPDNVTTIGKAAFAENQLTNVILPDSVNTINEAAFVNNQLTSITMGANVDLITNEWGGPFDKNFHIFYNNNGRKAGVYTWDGIAWSFQVR